MHSIGRRERDKARARPSPRFATRETEQRRRVAGEGAPIRRIRYFVASPATFIRRCGAQALLRVGRPPAAAGGALMLPLRASILRRDFRDQFVTVVGS
jgi:hypothetical protein